MANRIRRCKDRREFERVVDDFVTTGYTVTSRGEDNALLIKKGSTPNTGLYFC